MTALTSAEIEDYYQRVRDSLADLDAPIRDDLLEDLPDHLAEVAAEGTGSLLDRLGAPEAYAAELRTAAGLGTGSGDVRSSRSWAERGRRLAKLLDRADVGLARPLGYSRLSELLVALRPGWWVVRGWVVAQLLCGTHNRASWHGVLPSLGGNRALGLVLLLVAIAVSIWLGRRNRDWTVWPRRLLAAMNVLIAGLGLFVLAANIGGTEYVYSYSQTGSSGPVDGLTDVYGYDSNGNLVPGLRLFDQAGNPLQVGSDMCQDGSQAFGTLTQPWTYPLCPTDPGPFRAGPGALPSDALPSGALPSGQTAPSASTRPSKPAAIGSKSPAGGRPAATPARSR